MQVFDIETARLATCLTTGKQIKINLEHVSLYRMLCRFTNDHNDSVNITWDELCSLVGLAYTNTKAKRSLKELQEIGMIYAGNKKTHSHKHTRGVREINWVLSNPDIKSLRSKLALKNNWGR